MHDPEFAATMRLRALELAIGHGVRPQTREIAQVYASFILGDDQAAAEKTLAAVRAAAGGGASDA